MAGICERTPVPTGVSSHSPARHAAHNHIATSTKNRDSNPKNDLGTAVLKIWRRSSDDKRDTTRSWVIH